MSHALPRPVPGPGRRLAGPRSPELRRPLPARVALVALCGLLGAAAIYGGIGLLDHDVIGMPTWWLAAGPFASWTVPGIALLVVVALPMAVAAGAELSAARWAPVATLVAGGVQVSWIAAELLLLERYHPLQAVVLVIAATILVVAGAFPPVPAPVERPA